MELILWRHAEAEDGVADAKRKLTPKGEKQAKKVGRWLAKRLPDDTRVLSSPAVRARQTAQALGRRFATDKAIGTGAGPSDVLAATGWPEGEGTVVVVGHQPTFGEIAGLLLTGEPVELSIKKGAAWWFESRQRNGERETALKAVIGAESA
jgi:phosphohistidine phosphatase